MRLFREKPPHTAWWPMSPGPLNYHHHLLPFLLNGLQHVTWTTWVLRPEGPNCIYCPSTYLCVCAGACVSVCACMRVRVRVRVCVRIHACVCVLWKDEASNTERPGQIQWYCPQQSLYIATQTGPQDEYNLFWLNTETTQPCRQKERDWNRQDSSGGFCYI